MSLNLRPRHLSDSQRALVAAKIATLPRGTNQHASIEAATQGEAAESLNVGRASVQHAREVLDHGALERAADNPRYCAIVNRRVLVSQYV